jgi:signal transduction histidine kinase
MGELRQILGVLRDTTGELPPTTPVLSDLESLIRSMPELDVRVAKRGSMEAIPTGIALSAFRVVQEALTNAQRHAGPHVVVDVVVDRSPERLSLTVSDNGRGASTRARTNGGYGLIGMGERVAAFGGSLRTGPRRSGGWEVRAQFPLSDAPVPA